MNNAEIAAQVQRATLECILSIIPLYFVIAKVVLFVLAFCFSIILVGILIAGKLLLAVLAMVAAHQRKIKLVGVTI